MDVPTRRTVVNKRHEIVVDGPATMKNWEYAWSMACRWYQEVHGEVPSYDNSLMVEAADDEILIWFAGKESVT